MLFTPGIHLVHNQSGPLPGVIEVSPNSKSVAAFKNYNPTTGVEFVFDPETNRFAVGIPKDYVYNPRLSPHENLARSIGADPRKVVGGIFTGSSDGVMYTNEARGCQASEPRIGCNL